MRLNQSVSVTVACSRPLLHFSPSFLLLPHHNQSIPFGLSHCIEELKSNSIHWRPRIESDVMYENEKEGREKEALKGASSWQVASCLF